MLNRNNGYMTCLCIIVYFFVFLFFGGYCFVHLFSTKHKLLPLLLFSLYFIRKMFIVKFQSLEQYFRWKRSVSFQDNTTAFRVDFFFYYFHSRKLVQVLCHNFILKLRLYRKGVKVIKWMVFKKNRFWWHFL